MGQIVATGVGVTSGFSMMLMLFVWLFIIGFLLIIPTLIVILLVKLIKHVDSKK